MILLRMEVKTLEQLRSPDPRALAFTPLGLSTMGLLKPEDAAEYQQQVVANCDLAENVTEGTRNSFERLRTLHSYGVLCYEAYTVAHDLAWLLREQALRERFLAFYNNVVPLVNAISGDTVHLTAHDFSAIDDAFRRGGSCSKGKWDIPLTDGTTMTFSGSMAQLQDWARKEHLLDGQRNKRLDPLHRSTRNHVAHPRYHIVMPVDSARIIHDLAEMINRLWGHPTPGGRLYPAPLERQVLIVAWAEADYGLKHTVMRDYQLEWFTEPGDWKCMVIRGVYEDEGVWGFDAQYERTNLPAEWLWGPGLTGGGDCLVEGGGPRARHGLLSRPAVCTPTSRGPGVACPPTRGRSRPSGRAARWPVAPDQSGLSDRRVCPRPALE